eukprot:4004754-Prymnesium_polylepis.1
MAAAAAPKPILVRYLSRPNFLWIASTLVTCRGSSGQSSGQPSGQSSRQSLGGVWITSTLVTCRGSSGQSSGQSSGHEGRRGGERGPGGERAEERAAGRVCKGL